MSTKLTRRPNLSGYSAIAGDLRSVLITGGRNIPENKFIPALNLSAHADHSWFDINHDATPLADRSAVDHIDGKVSYRHDSKGLVHEFLNVEDDGRLKWDIVYDNPGKVPSTISFKMRHSNNLSFYRQDDFSAGDVPGVEILIPSPEVVNSYAVYYNDGTRNNKYRTGKVGHIYSPYFVDEAGAISPLLDMNITPDIDNAKRLTFDVNADAQAWLDSPARVGKIRLDPTIGYTSIGGIDIAFSGPYRDRWYSKPFLADESGTVTDLQWYGRSITSGPSPKLKAGMGEYPNGTSPATGPIIAGHEIIGAISSNQWNVALESEFIQGSKQIDAGKTYSFVFASDQAYQICRYDNIAPTHTIYDTVSINYANAFRDPTGNPTGAFGRQWTLSFFATFGPPAIGKSKSHFANPLGIKSAFNKTGSMHVKQPGTKRSFK